MLYNLLKNNIVSFTFRKVNGEVRHAIGTRNLALAEKHTCTSIPRPKNEEQPNSYFDIEKMGWRSYKPELLISINKVIDASGFPAKVYPTNPTPETPAPKTAETDRAPISGILGGFSVSKEEVRKDWEELGKDIDLLPLGGLGGMPIGIGAALGGGAKVGTPKMERDGIALPISGMGGGSEMTIDDFARLIAKYVVAELLAKLTR